MITLLNDLVDKRINELVSLGYLHKEYIFFTKEILKEVKLCKLKNMIIIENFVTITKKGSNFTFSYNNSDSTLHIFKINFEEIINSIYDKNIFKFGLLIHECTDEQIYVRKIYSMSSIFEVDKYITFDSKESMVRFNEDYSKFTTVFEPILYNCLIDYIEDNFKVKNTKNNI